MAKQVNVVLVISLFPMNDQKSLFQKVFNNEFSWPREGSASNLFGLWRHEWSCPASRLRHCKPRQILIISPLALRHHSRGLNGAFCEARVTEVKKTASGWQKLGCSSVEPEGLPELLMLKFLSSEKPTQELYQSMILAPEKPILS